MSPPTPPETDRGASSAGSPHPVELGELTKRCMGRADLALILLDKFETQIRDDLAEITGQLARSGAEAIVSTAHSLKGAAGAVAAPALHNRAAAIESMARGSDLESVADELGSLRAEVDRCLGFLPEARERLAVRRDGDLARKDTPE